MQAVNQPHAVVAVRTLVALCLCLLAGCGTATKAVQVLGLVKDKALEVVGLKAPEPQLPDLSRPARPVKLIIHASPSLNVDDSGRSLALVTRIYKLRRTQAFLQAPYETFGDREREQAQLGEDIVEVRDLQLLPDQRHEILERVTREAPYIGVVALFRAPAPQRWRYAFSADAVRDTGITLGAHACSLSVAAGEPLHATSQLTTMGPGPCPGPQEEGVHRQ
ncbi:type VI secretion system lipoprotein TssJ [Caldimonas thermodepolymerans]|uniref:Type VI secretion system lipoprotein TssJ n=1 Tax=Caldimonas thermodepolymerans TaxID=215580 RepID=A0A2S5T613_9BURK|nr:type VI secretion system lipoprotein TssJ [Caldimonas thermodepolymerans]PPE70396.1 type VI secretion system lipoprotein TssJ [Caldimonas thermodepolymerans]QPC30303.1 type VI secretion system lipoprotein TssJ [Caldimonas thermodepolymerans]RDI00699.1 type VI secretion system protein VasD [Caldimonas thermodepolymerans]TCP07022.1 type VI secretion system protein VasD [Caldimonas thermodepolymerans]UZG46730.1 type VI secretion system lipoprotein TssJ [Caldimonas thermodepolymerans]